MLWRSLLHEERRKDGRGQKYSSLKIWLPPQPSSKFQIQKLPMKRKILFRWPDECIASMVASCFTELAKFLRSSNACIVSASNPPANCSRERQNTISNNLCLFLKKNAVNEGLTNCYLMDSKGKSHSLKKHVIHCGIFLWWSLWLKFHCYSLHVHFCQLHGTQLYLQHRVFWFVHIDLDFGCYREIIQQ